MCVFFCFFLLHLNNLCPKMKMNGFTFWFFVIVFTIGKVFAVWTGSKSFWNYIRASQKLDYLSIVLFVGLVMEVSIDGEGTRFHFFYIRNFLKLLK